MYPVAQPYRGRTSTGLAQLCPCLPDEDCHSSDDAQHHPIRFTISTNTHHHIAKLESHGCCGRYTKRINREGTKLVGKTVVFCIRKVPGLSEKCSTVVNAAALRCVRFLSLDLMEVAEYGLALQSVKSIVESLDSIRFLITSQTVRRICYCLFTVFQCVTIRLVGIAALFAFCIDVEGLGGCAHLLSLTILPPHLANIEQVLTLVQGSSGSSRRERALWNLVMRRSWLECQLLAYVFLDHQYAQMPCAAIRPCGGCVSTMHNSLYCRVTTQCLIPNLQPMSQLPPIGPLNHKAAELQD